MDSFYVTLPSNVKNGGTMSSYVTELPCSLELPGKWEVGLTEIYLPHSWHNIDPSNNAFEFSEGAREEGMPPYTPVAESVAEDFIRYNRMRADDGEVNASVFTHAVAEVSADILSDAVLPVGYYPSIKDILDAIRNSLSPLARENIKLQVNSDDTVTVNTYREAYLWLGEGLAAMLGFTEPGITGKVRGKYPADVKNGLYSALIYTDIILPQIIGDVQAPVLRVIPLDGKPGKLISYRFISPDYVPLARSSISTIAINIRTDHGERIVFHSGKVMCKLHFRPSFS